MSGREIPCVGGLLDGKTVRKDEPEEVIYQHGLWVVRVHRPYPKRKGDKITERLLAYTDTYRLEVTPDGPVYRCAHPVAGLAVDDSGLLTPSEGGAYDVWARPDGTLSPRPL
jgi:hypothetical protein